MILHFFSMQASNGNLLTQFGPLLLIVGVFWLFFIRPQSKKAKEQKSFSHEITKGDEVVTASGIIGRINKIEDEIVTLQVDTKTFIRVPRTVISKEMTEAILSGNEKK